MTTNNEPIPFTKGPSKGPEAVTLSVDAKLLEQLDSLVSTMESWPAVRELGVVVTRETAARVALVRGLEQLRTTGPVVNPSKKAPASAKSPVEDEEKPELNCEFGEDGFIIPPDGWELAPSTESVVAAHVSAHEYYTSRGWDRFWGRSGTETIYFYWSKDRDQHSLELFPGLKKQETPWGPGHFIPHNYVPPEVSGV